MKEVCITVEKRNLVKDPFYLKSDFLICLLKYQIVSILLVLYYFKWNKSKCKLVKNKMYRMHPVFVDLVFRFLRVK